MTTFNQFSREERAEIDALIHEAYTDENGETRTHVEAAEEFDRLLTSAVQAHREWAGMLLDDWRYEGMKKFIGDRYKHSELFTFTRRDRQVTRTVKRGRVKVDDEGVKSWHQEPLPGWTRRDLMAAIRAEEGAIADRQANIAMYRALVDLLDDTGAHTVAEALDMRSITLEQYLSERLAS
ncbi:MAG: hypothetical protein Q4F65_11995 [Propionibacteriaceae bacterium]|nr:hypothetical protein [Propionibacteriaceae bacterium]